MEFSTKVLILGDIRVSNSGEKLLVNGAPLIVNGDFNTGVLLSKAEAQALYATLSVVQTVSGDFVARQDLLAPKQNAILIDDDGVVAGDFDLRQLVGPSGIPVVDWKELRLNTPTGTPSLDWKNHVLYGKNNDPVAKFDGPILKDGQDLPIKRSPLMMTVDTQTARYNLAASAPNYYQLGDIFRQKDVALAFMLTVPSNPTNAGSWIQMGSFNFAPEVRQVPEIIVDDDNLGWGAEITLNSATLYWGSPNPTVAPVWQGTQDGTTWDDLESGTAAFLVTDTDYYSYRLKVTLTNTLGSVTTYSNVVARAEGAPVLVSPPTLAGNHESALYLQSVNATEGIWSSVSPINFTYQWYYKPAPLEVISLDGATAIVGATNPLFVLAGFGCGNAVFCVVTATNAAGSTQAVTAIATSSVRQAATAPIINLEYTSDTGALEEGATITYTGNHSAGGCPAPTYELEWMFDNTLSGVIDSPILLTQQHVGKVMKLQVRATNSAGQAVTTVELGIVAGDLFYIGGTTISGTPILGAQLTVSEIGTFGGYPAYDTVAYQWTWNGIPIEGETSDTYTTVPNDVAQTIACIVYVSVDSLASSAEGISNELLIGDPPVNTVLPGISGTASLGETLSGFPGTWLGTNLSSSYAWRGSTDPTILLGSDGTLVIPNHMAGQTIWLEITMTNEYGTAMAASLPTAQITNNYPAAGTYLGTSCQGFDLYQNTADGIGGSLSSLLESNSATCGYNACPPEGEVVGQTCVGQDLYNVVADGNCGTTQYLVEAGAAACP